jgi:hypothetical protein
MTLFVLGLLAHPSFADDGFVPLFDGETLDDWFTTRSTDSFSVNKKEKAIHTYAGKEHGSKQLPDCLVTKKQFSHYILRLEYKWLENRFSPRIDWDRDAGILFHAHGNLKRTWPYSIEMQLGETPGPVTGASKDYWKERKPRRFHTGDMFLIGPLQARYKRNGIWWDPNGELFTGGKPASWTAWSRLGVEKPKGEWNQVEIRVLGNQKATFILNDEVVFELMDLQKMENEEFVPLTKGHIGLQAEWAELLYRNIRIKELDVANPIEGVTPAVQTPEYENSLDYPLMGDWQGTWIDPKKGHEKAHPQMAAQLLPVRDGKYRVVILPELYNRAEPYLNIEVPATHERVEVKRNGFEVVFEGSKVFGQGKLHGDLTRFNLEKVPLQSPSLGMKPPKGATVLFDGTNFDAWQHPGGKAVTWKQVDDAMQVVTQLDAANKKAGLGGSIETKQKFGSMRFHMEFRYPVEADQSGSKTGRGNSGLRFLPTHEIQILNSYTTPNYWHECGAIYKRVPAKVDAAGPPLAWQTYDVEIELPGNGTAVMTVQLNGRIIHNKMVVNCNANEVSVWLQDHVNPLQFRNIWLVEK